MTGPDSDLIAENLACRRGERLVFSGLSFRLSRGGALLLTGSNGSGKTSLLRLIAGLAAPAAGRLAWGEAPIGADLTGYQARLRLVGHQDGVRLALTPCETLRFWAALHATATRPAAAVIERALAAFALEAVADWPCRWLSAGQRRRLALARLLVAPAPIWLLDEPTSALDDDNRLRLEQAIAAHRAGGGRVVLATHAPIMIDGADSLVLDAFTARPGDAAAG
jgi:heme exporter protein A